MWKQNRKNRAKKVNPFFSVGATGSSTRRTGYSMYILSTKYGKCVHRAKKIMMFLHVTQLGDLELSDLMLDVVMPF